MAVAVQQPTRRAAGRMEAWLHGTVDATEVRAVCDLSPPDPPRSLWRGELFHRRRRYGDCEAPGRLSRRRTVRCCCYGSQSLFHFWEYKTDDAKDEGRHSPPTIGFIPSAKSFAVSRLLSVERRTKSGAYLNTSVRSLQHTFTWVKSWQHLPQDHSVEEQRTAQTRMSRVPYRQTVV